MNDNTANENGMIRWPQVRQQYLPVCYNTMRSMVADGRFPAPIKLSPRVIAWRISDLREWLQARPAT